MKDTPLSLITQVKSSCVVRDEANVMDEVYLPKTIQEAKNMAVSSTK
jgi:hypothetical protein